MSFYNPFRTMSQYAIYKREKKPNSPFFWYWAKVRRTFDLLNGQYIGANRPDQRHLGLLDYMMGLVPYACNLLNDKLSSNNVPAWVSIPAKIFLHIPLLLKGLIACTLTFLAMLTIIPAIQIAEESDRNHNLKMERKRERIRKIAESKQIREKLNKQKRSEITVHDLKEALEYYDRHQSTDDMTISRLRKFYLQMVSPRVWEDRALSAREVSLLRTIINNDNTKAGSYARKTVQILLNKMARITPHSITTRLTKEKSAEIYTDIFDNHHYNIFLRDLSKYMRSVKELNQLKRRLDRKRPLSVDQLYEYCCIEMLGRYDEKNDYYISTPASLPQYFLPLLHELSTYHALTVENFRHIVSQANFFSTQNNELLSLVTYAGKAKRNVGEELSKIIHHPDRIKLYDAYDSLNDALLIKKGNWEKIFNCHPITGVAALLSRFKDLMISDEYTDEEKQANLDSAIEHAALLGHPDVVLAINRIPDLLRTQTFFDQVIFFCEQAMPTHALVEAIEHEAIVQIHRLGNMPLRRAPVTAQRTFNSSQSTHTATVHKSVSECASSLMQEYKVEFDALNIDSSGYAQINAWLQYCNSICVFARRKIDKKNDVKQIQKMIAVTWLILFDEDAHENLQWIWEQDEFKEIINSLDKLLKNSATGFWTKLFTSAKTAEKMTAQLSEIKDQLQEHKIWSQYLQKMDDEGELTLQLENIENAAKKFKAASSAFARLCDTDFADPVSGVKTRELLLVSWIAIHDQRGRIGNLTDAKMAYIQGLYECQREYNIDEANHDRGGADSPACAGGSFNKTVEKLDGVHRAVKLVYVTNETIRYKLNCIIPDYISACLIKMAAEEIDNLEHYLATDAEAEQDICLNKASEVTWNKLIETHQVAELTKEMKEGGYDVIFESQTAFEKNIKEQSIWMVDAYLQANKGKLHSIAFLKNNAKKKPELGLHQQSMFATVGRTMNVGVSMDDIESEESSSSSSLSIM